MRGLRTYLLNWLSWPLPQITENQSPLERFKSKSKSRRSPLCLICGPRSLLEWVSLASSSVSLWCQSHHHLTAARSLLSLQMSVVRWQITPGGPAGEAPLTGNFPAHVSMCAAFREREGKQSRIPESHVFQNLGLSSFSTSEGQCQPYLALSFFQSTRFVRRQSLEPYTLGKSSFCWVRSWLSWAILFLWGLSLPREGKLLLICNSALDFFFHCPWPSPVTLC